MAHYIDIHCHPCLKYYLFGTPLTDDTQPPDDQAVLDFPGARFLYASLPRMIRGNVDTVISAYYVPEHDLIKRAKITPWLRAILMAALKHTLDRFEDVSSPGAVFEQTKAHVTTFKQHVADVGGVCPTTRAELAAARAAGKPVFLQSVEGAHHLGRGLARTQDYLDNLNWLAGQGICSLTLAHFFPNDCISPVVGMPPHIVNLLGYPTSFPDTGLSSIGEQVVRWMLENGMIVDLMHGSPRARRAICDIARTSATRRPVVFSHAGAAEVFNRHAAAGEASYGLMNPTDDEIRFVQRTNGVIGIVMMQYWLRGIEEANQVLGLGIIPDPGLSYVVETVQHIHDITGSYDNIAIGSDYDGFTDVIDDAPDISYTPKIADALNRSGIAAADVDKIMTQNALRVIADGWGR